mgnify:CR=1 FL=1
MTDEGIAKHQDVTFACEVMCFAGGWSFVCLESTLGALQKKADVHKSL